MNGIAQAILAVTPLAALVLYFALSGQKQVRTDQQLHDVKQEIEETQFDIEFELMSQEISGNPADSDKLASKQTKLNALKKKEDAWERQFDAEFQKQSEELDQLKDSFKDMQ